MPVVVTVVSTHLSRVCLCVHHLVESCVHLIHQVNVEPAEKSPVLLGVSEHISLLHLVTHDPHNGVLHSKNSLLSLSKKTKLKNKNKTFQILHVISLNQ